MPGIGRYLAAVQSELPSEVYEAREHWDASLTNAWLTALRRLLLRIQQYGHGGAILITPDADLRDLNVKYRIAYPRFRSSLHRRAVFTIRSTQADDEIINDYLHKEDSDEIPTGLYLDASVAEIDLDEARDELDGVLWFVSLLSRVDGLVLLTPDLDVRGFGVEIQTSVPPASLLRATDADASPERRVAINYNHFGTRHRSMMRYCASVPGSVGFVVSQDGDVRAMTLVGGNLIVWDNVKLRLDDFARHRPKTKKDAPPVA